MRRIVLFCIVVMFTCAAVISLSLIPTIVTSTFQSGPFIPAGLFDEFGQLSRESNIPVELVMTFVVLPVVVIAGISESLGQCYILFANRVKPLRFMLTLAINILTFVASFFLTVFAVWIVGRYVYGIDNVAQRAMLAVGFAYAPLMLGFLSVLPYFGSYVMYLLYLIAYIRLAELLVQVGFGAFESFITAVLALVIVYALRATVGRPVIWLLHKLMNLAAGTQLEKSLKTLAEYRGAYFIDTGTGNDTTN